MTTMICPECNGTGSVSVIIGDEQGADRCPSCGGSGCVKVVEPITIDENEVMGSETVSMEDIAA